MIEVPQPDTRCNNCEWVGIDGIDTVPLRDDGGPFEGCPNCLTDGYFDWIDAR